MSKPFCPHPSCWKTVFNGFQAGLLYGAKVRFPHSLVVTLVFRRNLSYRAMAMAILKATVQHSAKLGVYVAFFKSLCCLFRNIRRAEDDVYNHLVAGIIAGSTIFGSDDPVSTQINLYILSRVILASINSYLHPAKLPAKVFAGISWGAVMAIYFSAPEHLQLSLRSSMKTLYTDTEKC